MKASKKYQLSDNVDYVQEQPTQYLVSKKPVSLHDMSTFDKMDIVKRGVTKRYLESFKKRADLDYDQLAKVLSVTRATLINKKGEDTFNDHVSERIISLADLYAFGYDVFGQPDRFNRWMFTPNQALDKGMPFDIVDNYYGREAIRNIVGRIAYGVYS